MKRNIQTFQIKQTGESITPDGYKFYNVQLEKTYLFIIDSNGLFLSDLFGYLLQSPET